MKAGQVVKVRVLEIDEKRKRIALTMRLSDEAPKPAVGAKSDQRSPNRPNTTRPQDARKSQEDRRSAPLVNNAMAAAFGKLKK